jgi:hypothetical protein
MEVPAPFFVLFFEKICKASRKGGVTLDRYEPKLNSPDNIECRLSIPDLIKILLSSFGDEICGRTGE